MARMGARISLEAELTARRWDAGIAGRALEAWRESGESLATFARRHRIHAQRLSWWRKQIGTRGRRMRSKRAGVAAVTFVPATVAGMGGARVAVRLPGGVEVEAVEAAALPASWIAALLRELASGP